jgi:ribosomal protein S1
MSWKFVVIGVDRERQRISLSIKRAAPTRGNAM